MSKNPSLKPQKIKGRIRVLKVMPYEGHMVYLRMINEDMFEWLISYKNEIYASYMVFTRPAGQKTLSEEQIAVASNLVWAGATATIDELMGKKLTPEQEEKAKLFDHLSGGSQAN